MAIFCHNKTDSDRRIKNSRPEPRRAAIMCYEYLRKAQDINQGLATKILPEPEGTDKQKQRICMPEQFDASCRGCRTDKICIGS